MRHQNKAEEIIPELSYVNRRIPLQGYRVCETINCTNEEAEKRNKLLKDRERISGISADEVEAKHIDGIFEIGGSETELSTYFVVYESQSYIVRKVKKLDINSAALNEEDVKEGPMFPSDNSSETHTAPAPEPHEGDAGAADEEDKTERIHSPKNTETDSQRSYIFHYTWYKIPSSSPQKILGIGVKEAIIALQAVLCIFLCAFLAYIIWEQKREKPVETPPIDSAVKEQVQRPAPALPPPPILSNKTANRLLDKWERFKNLQGSDLNGPWLLGNKLNEFFQQDLLQKYIENDTTKSRKCLRIEWFNEDPAPKFSQLDLTTTATKVLSELFVLLDQAEEEAHPMENKANTDVQ